MAAAAYDEERAKLYASSYMQQAPPPPVSALRAKDPSPGPLSNLHMHHRAGPGPGGPQAPPSAATGQPQVRQLESMVHNAVDLHKKDDSAQSR